MSIFGECLHARRVTDRLFPRALMLVTSSSAVSAFGPLREARFVEQGHEENTRCSQFAATLYQSPVPQGHVSVQCGVFLDGGISFMRALVQVVSLIGTVDQVSVGYA